MNGTTAPLKRVATIKARVGWKGLTSDEFELRSDAYLVTGRDFRGRYIDWKTCYQVSKERYEDDPFIQLRNGDILVTKDGTIGKVAVVDGLDKPACLNSGVFVVRPGRDLDASYLYWILQSEVFSDFIAEVSRGSTIQHLYQEEFREMRIPLREFQEQRAIADYLDHETAQIDAFIAKNEELIALLTERRTAVIARATTMGVRDGVNPIDSGLPWVGMIPSTWRVQPTRTVLRVSKSTVGADWSETPLLSLTKRGVIVRDIENGEGKFPASFEGYQRVYAGDLVFCLFDMDETPRTVGLVHSFGMVTGAYTRFVVNPDVADARFLELYYIAIDDEKRLRPLYTGLRKVIKKDRFLSAGIPLPGLDEQREIADWIDEKLAQIGHALAVAERGIALARERRTALISAAVTGRIDVGVAV